MHVQTFSDSFGYIHFRTRIQVAMTRRVFIDFWAHKSGVTGSLDGMECRRATFLPWIEPRRPISSAGVAADRRRPRSATEVASARYRPSLGIVHLRRSHIRVRTLARILVAGRTHRPAPVAARA